MTGPLRLQNRLSALALLAALAPAGVAYAQTPPALLAPPSQVIQTLPPGSVPTAPPPPQSKGAATAAPVPLAIPPGAVAPQPSIQLRAGEVALQLSARFAKNTPITGGLHWRIYADKPDQSGVFRLLKEDRSAAPLVALPAGGYVVHVAFGLASSIRAVKLRDEPVREVFDLSAGGLRMEGRVGDARILPTQISFEIYKGSQFDVGEKRPIASNVTTGEIVLLPEGTYFIVSKYGEGNAVVRSDIRVQAGKLTDVTVSHRAAAIMLKLVSHKDGPVLANTDWVVASPAGDVITETKGAFPRVILAEGEYRVIARNDNKSYSQDIKVITGVDGEIEVLARP
jgi:hypothetical protein